MAALKKNVFKMFADLIYNEAGICLGENKLALVSARLGKRMRCLGIEDYREYYNRVRKHRSRQELSRLLDAISTNVTCFFREQGHFEILFSLVRQWEAEGQNRFRFWSAACSTGEEPYTIRITASEALKNSNDAKILATDINTSVLATAVQGEYEAKKLENVSRKMISKYFVRIRNNGEKIYRIDEKIKRRIQFSWLNLSAPLYPMKGPMNVIFLQKRHDLFRSKSQTATSGRNIPAAESRRLSDGGALRKHLRNARRFQFDMAIGLYENIV